MMNGASHDNLPKETIRKLTSLGILDETLTFF
jgi:hypothetical protein